MKSISVVLVVLAMLALAFLLTRPEPLIEQEYKPAGNLTQTENPQVKDLRTPALEMESVVEYELDCPDFAGQIDPRKSLGDIRNELASAVVSLQGSGQPEHRLAAAILLGGEEPRSTMSLLQQLLAFESTAKLAAFQMLRLCDERNRTACLSPPTEEAIIRADSDNGVMWVKIASMRLDAGREHEAIDALRRAIDAPDFDNYFNEQIDVIEGGLAAVTGWSYPERVVYGADAVSSNPLSLGGIRGFCQLSTTVGWHEVCNTVGERILVEGGDISTRLQGAELRLALEENRESPELMASIEDDRDRLKAMQSGSFSDARQLNLLLNDESVMREFVEAYDAGGEEGAMLHLEELAARLRATPDYDQCNFASNPFFKMPTLD